MEAKFRQCSLAAAPPDATQMQPHATLSSKIAATQPSRRGLPQITVRNGFSPSSPAVPIRLARNGADTMKLKDLREIGFVRRKNAEPPLPNRPGLRQPTVASNRRAAPILIPMRGLHSHPLRSLRRHPTQAPPRMPTPLISMAMASFVQFCIRPESRPQPTNLPNPAQSRTTGASLQPPAREARHPHPLAFLRKFSHHHIPQATTKG